MSAEAMCQDADDAVVVLKAMAGGHSIAEAAQCWMARFAVVPAPPRLGAIKRWLSSFSNADGVTRAFDWSRSLD